MLQKALSHWDGSGNRLHIHPHLSPTLRLVAGTKIAPLTLLKKKNCALPFPLSWHFPPKLAFLFPNPTASSTGSTGRGWPQPAGT